MMRRRTMLLSLCAAVTLSAVGVAGYLLVQDTDETVEAIRLDGFSVAPTIEPSAEEGRSRSVDGLEQLVGVLHAGDDVDDWYVAGVEVDFGPEEWLLTDPVVDDFDGDGVADPLPEELSALEGTEVTLGVRYDDDDDTDRDDARVFTVNGMILRDTAGGPAPWESGEDAVEADRAAVASAAEAAVGEGARVVDVERTEEDGWQGWEADVRGGDGREYDVILDLSGEVVDVRQDD
ncbi:PepSY domain-containing protein [Nocardiopsis sp. MG754419]|uniref:PepSY domain-containing protein n=1 Tax=Nocardiopsis sp. MG754419 TaxID=2259865 RepID=UPI001BAA2A72|nr:hypothetical protein [Nocardiopsis sp. MG754419]